MKSDSYVQIALGSASETTYHLLVARDLDLIALSTYDDLTGRITEVRRMLTGLLKRLDQNAVGSARARPRDAVVARGAAASSDS